MAEKGFGVKEIKFVGSSPKIESLSNLDLSATTVAISTNATVGGNLTVSGNVSVGGTLTYEDVTNIDSVGIVTAREGVIIPDSKALSLGNRLVGSTAGDLRLYHDGSNSYIDEIGSGNLFIRNGSDNAIFCQTNGTVKLYHDGAERLATSSAGVTITGTVSATIFNGNGSSLTNLPASQLTGTLPALDGSALTGIAVTEAPVTDYTITGDGSHYYFHGGGVDETAGDPDLYLIRGQKYRFNNTTGSSHPFEFRAVSNGSPYTNGVTGDDEGVQFFTVPYDAPAKIFYICTVHSGMVGNIYIRGAGGQNDNIGVTTFTGRVTISSAAPNLLFTETDANPDWGILCSGGQMKFQDVTNVANIMTLDDNKIQAVKNLDALAGVDVTSGDLNIGSSVGRFDSSGLIKTAHGSASAPSHTFINDPDNGMYRPTTNTLGFVTGGTERLRIDSSGLINVKTRSAEVRRVILSGSPTNSAFNIEAHDGETGESSGDVQGKLGLFYNDGSTLTNTACISFIRGSGAPDGSMALVTNQTERFRIASDGVIHVASPDSASGGRIWGNGSALLLQSGNGRQTLKVSDAAPGVNRTIEMTSAGNLKFPVGTNIGIDFSAKTNLSGATKTTLVHYEEGTWTPTLVNLDVPGHVTTDYATYTRVGRIVTISVKFTISSSVNDASGFGFNLPYGPVSDRQIVIPAISDRSGTNKAPFAFNNVNSSHNVYAKALEGYAFQSYNLFSGNYIVATGSYETDAL